MATSFEAKALARRHSARLDPAELGGRRRQAHDRLFRQLIAIEDAECPERGQLLARVREEGEPRARSLYESCLAQAATRHLLARRRALRARRQLPELRAAIARLQAEMAALKAGLEARKAQKRQEEAVRQVEWGFLEGQLQRANDQMTGLVEDKLDSERKWLHRGH